MKKTLAFILCIFSAIASADDSIYIQEFLKEAKRVGDILNKDIRHKNYLEQVHLTEELLKENRGNPMTADIITQHLTVLYSIVGEYQEVLNYEMGKNNYKIIKDSPLDYSSIPAIPAISALAKHHQIVMINEAHHIPQHRTMTYHLLEALWQQGFRYFAVEALHQGHMEALDKGYIESPGVGYLSEPVFANLLLKAKALGFILVDYDKAISSTEARETSAANILKEKIFDKDKDAKVLIHVGYAHIDEETWLASKLKSLLNIDPLTIDQTSLREQNSPPSEHHIYREILEKYKNSEPFVLKNTHDAYWSSSENQWDISVFWPRTEYTQGRPNWMSLGRGSTPISADICEKNYPCMVEVFKSKTRHENEAAIDRIILHNAQDKKVIFTSEQQNLVVVSNYKGAIISEFTIQ
jgi:hypothetical protein